jgi:phosphoribosylaminoimidazolecarboxamide formyltransferase/IMP cyclohydrolase
MRAIISVSDKTDVDILGRGLADLGAEIYSTGGTKRALDAAGVPVRLVSDLTGFPEILGGRVKTLHPAVHGGILARRDLPTHRDELAQHGLGLIDLVAVNLYPFEATVAQLDVTPGLSPAEGLAAALEQIDIGGPTMLRAAAKNFPAALPLCDPADYPAALAGLRRPGGPDEGLRRRLAAKAFRHTAVYDAIIAAYLGTQDDAGWPDKMPLALRKVRDLRYGENPQQRAAFYTIARPGQGKNGLVAAQQLQGKPLSYNNLLDASAAWTIASDFPPVTVAIIKHTNPCGLARADDPLAAYELALAGDPLAAFGGIVAVNATVDGPLARRVVERFYEIVLAPDFSAEGLEALAARPNLRVLALPFDRLRAGSFELEAGAFDKPRGLLPDLASDLAWRSIAGGVLIQETDRLDEAEVRQGRVVTRRAPTDAEWAALSFAWRAVRHVKSNAIVLAQGGTGQEPGRMALVGMGAGQPSRVAAVEIAVQRAGPRATGAALASDAFFPMPDGVEAATRAGVRAVVQPGGSQGDEAVIAAADAADVAMVLTGRRHFLH